MSTLALDTGPGDRPIRHESAVDNHVVHGLYGLSLLSGRDYVHITLTWSSGRARLISITATDIRTGDPLWWYVPTALLHDGGRQGTTRVDHAGQITFLEITGATRSTWIALNRAWVTELLDTIDHYRSPT